MILLLPILSNATCRSSIPFTGTSTIRLHVFCIALLLLGTAGCTKTDDHDECVQNLSQKILNGTPQPEAEQALDHCGIPHSFDERTKTINGLKQGSGGGLIRQGWSVQIKLDGRLVVTSLTVKKVFTGP
jgi:hypothetical protein